MATKRCKDCDRTERVVQIGYRHLCNTCRETQNALIRAGITTDQELVDQGKRAPIARTGRPRRKKAKS